MAHLAIAARPWGRVAAAGLSFALLAVAPRAQENLRERAAAAENAGRFSDAADAWLALCKEDPTRVEWFVAAARCLGRSGRFNDALDLLEAKRKEMPHECELLAMLARTHLLKVETDPGVLYPELSYRDARDLADEILRADATHAEALLMRAQALYGLGEWDAATAAADAAVAAHPERAGSHILVARIAWDLFRQFLRVREETKPEGQADAELLASMDVQRKRAIAAFTRAAEIEPQRTFARVMLGTIAAVDKDNEKALDHWRKALSIDPNARVDHDWIRGHLAPADRANYYDAANTAYLAGEDHRPEASALLLFHAGRALFEQGDVAGARSRFERCLAQNPQYQNAAYYGALCAYRLDDHDGAENLAAGYAAFSATGFADVLRGLDPEERAGVAAIVRYLADRAYQKGRVDHSRDLNHVIACLLDSADAWNNHAFLCRETARFDDAFASYQHAIEKEPDAPQLWNDAAVVLQYHQPTPENLERARSMYQKARELAAAVLADGKSTELQRDRARKAQEDVRLNLEKLDAK